jgi:hypothetical protein
MNVANATNNMYAHFFKLKKLISNCKNSKKIAFDIGLAPEKYVAENYSV